MMRVATFAAVAGALPLAAARILAGSSREQCVPLMNRGAYFGVEVAVGSPEQRFELVADTGSNNLLVASCVCHSSGGCQGAEHCFRGTNRSSTFSIDDHAADKALAITYGSGTIEAVTATDKARVGPLSATMHNSLLLMVSDAQLNIEGTFEGILGLGVPGPTEEEDEPEPTGPSAPWKGFLDEANVTSFSMCFSEGTEGSMEMGAAVPNALQAIGRYHWGVGLSGISVGGGDQDGTATLSFCQKDDPDAGDDTPCGLIPDSGTTLMMGPEAHVAALYASICDQWTYCSTKFDQVLQGAADGGDDDDEVQVEQDLGSGAIFSKFPTWNPPQHGGREAYSEEALTQAKALTLLAVLEACDDWLSDGGSEFNGMPSVHMKITDLAGKDQDIELTPWSYVMVSDADVTDLLWKPKAKGIDAFPAFPSLLQKAVQRRGRERVRVCQPAFDTMEYQTRNNGAVWILGSPLFFQYKVGYDLTGPSMSFTKMESEDSCRSCTSQESMMLRGKISTPLHRRPRGLKGPIRRPRIDTTRPL